MRNIFIILSLSLLLGVGCNNSTGPDENPDWVNDLIEQFKSEPAGSPPQSIWRYKYNRKTVYYVPAQCCDQFSTLYNADGDTLCAPDGGFSRAGDGRCSDFIAERKNEKLIWQDSRKR